MKLGFSKPQALTENEINTIINRFAYSAKLAKECGFTGVQIHGAHGYLINQFLSPLHNKRVDQWGGSARNRMRFVLEVYRAIRKEVGSDYPIAIKLNSTDAQTGGYTEEDAIIVAKKLDQEGIDFIEVSGGNYESQAMMGSDESIKQGGGYFVNFSEKLKCAVNTPVMVTGGLRKPELMNELLKERKCDLIGMGRPFALLPDIPNKILSNEIKEVIETPYIKTGIALLDKIMLINITWYEQQLRLLGKGYPSQPKMSPWLSILHTISAMGIKALLPRRS